LTKNVTWVKKNPGGLFFLKKNWVFLNSGLKCQYIHKIELNFMQMKQMGWKSEN